MDNLTEYKLKLYKDLLNKINGYKSNIILLKKHNYTTAVAEYEYDILICKNTLEYIRKTLNIQCDLFIFDDFMKFFCGDKILKIFPKGVFVYNDITLTYNSKTTQPIELAAKVFDVPLELIKFRTINIHSSLADEMGCSNP